MSHRGLPQSGVETFIHAVVIKNGILRMRFPQKIWLTLIRRSQKMHSGSKIFLGEHAPKPPLAQNYYGMSLFVILIFLTALKMQEIAFQSLRKSKMF